MSVCQSVCGCPSSETLKKLLIRYRCKVCRIVLCCVEVIRFRHLTLTFDLEIYFSISTRHPPPCVSDIDSPRSKRCEGESTAVRQGVSGRSVIAAHAVLAGGSAQSHSLIDYPLSGTYELTKLSVTPSQPA